jgi:CMP-N,N'-diacetyllegionaminic acid synthase
MGLKVKRLCTICARGGSKGLKDKNLRELCGKPLIAHSILQAKASALFDAVAVSSDSERILNAAREWGADYLVIRPPGLAGDAAPKVPAIRHCVLEAERMAGKVFDTLVDLDATSPLRLPGDIVGAIALLERGDCANVITGSPARRSPYFNMVEIGEDNIARLCKKPAKPVERRQDAPRCYDMNASVYVWRRKTLFDLDGVLGPDTRLFEMPEERSLDIDTELDFEIVEYLMRKKASS